MNKTENFIQKAKELFPEYDYSKSIYTRARDNLLRGYCKDSGINLVEISYKEKAKKVLDKVFRFDLE